MTAHRTSWRNPRVLLTLLLVFALGGICGALVMKYRHREASRSATMWRPESRVQALKRFKTELKLTEVQAEQMGGMLDDYSLMMQVLQAQMDDVRMGARERVMEILTPDQRVQFVRMASEMTKPAQQ